MPKIKKISENSCICANKKVCGIVGCLREHDLIVAHKIPIGKRYTVGTNKVRRLFEYLYPPKTVVPPVSIPIDKFLQKINWPGVKKKVKAAATPVQKVSKVKEVIVKKEKSVDEIRELVDRLLAEPAQNFHE